MMKGMISAALPKGRVNEYTWSFPYDEKNKTFDTSSFDDTDGEGIVTKQEIDQFCEQIVEQKE